MYIGLYTVYARLGQRGSRGRPQGVRRHTLRLGTYGGSGYHDPRGTRARSPTGTLPYYRWARFPNMVS